MVPPVTGITVTGGASIFPPGSNRFRNLQENLNRRNENQCCVSILVFRQFPTKTKLPVAVSVAYLESYKL